jgi:hypothetical protein
MILITFPVNYGQNLPKYNYVGGIFEKVKASLPAAQSVIFLENDTNSWTHFIRTPFIKAYQSQVCSREIRIF